MRIPRREVFAWEEETRHKNWKFLWRVSSSQAKTSLLGLFHLDPALFDGVDDGGGAVVDFEFAQD